MENEINRIWKPIKGFEGIYELSDDGLLHCLPKPHRRIEYTYGSLDSDGYLRLSLTKNGIEKTKRVNILVYETFVGPIPEGYDVHHINGNKKDNRIENLSLIEKHCHGKLHGKDKIEEISKLGKSKSKPVLQYSIDGKFINEYKSATEAQRKTGINASLIGKCCNNIEKLNKYGKIQRHKIAGGFKWKWKEVA